MNTCYLCELRKCGGVSRARDNFVIDSSLGLVFVVVVIVNARPRRHFGAGSEIFPKEKETTKESSKNKERSKMLLLLCFTFNMRSARFNQQHKFFFICFFLMFRAWLTRTARAYWKVCDWRQLTRRRRRIERQIFVALHWLITILKLHSNSLCVTLVLVVTCAAHTQRERVFFIIKAHTN